MSPTWLKSALRRHRPSKLSILCGKLKKEIYIASEFAKVFLSVALFLVLKYQIENALVNTSKSCSPNAMHVVYKRKETIL